MRTAEFYCGNKSFSKVAKERGHNTLTYDNKTSGSSFKLPDMDLYSVIIFLQHFFEGDWVVENSSRSDKNGLMQDNQIFKNGKIEGKKWQLILQM